MQAKAKQIVITTESHEVFIVRGVRRSETVVCPSCGEQWTADDLDPAGYSKPTHGPRGFIDDRLLADGLKREE